MPMMLEFRTEDGPRYARACWVCREAGRATAVRMPVEREADAKAMPARCDDCHRRMAAGLPPEVAGRRLDA